MVIPCPSSLGWCADQHDFKGYSVDVVDMADIAGPHHVHPNGEIDLIMPIEGDATFDGRPGGWAVNPPGSRRQDRVHEVGVPAAMNF